MSGTHDRFSTGYVSTAKVAAIPPNSLGLSPLECLEQSILSVPGVVRVDIAADHVGVMYLWTIEKQFGYRLQDILPAVDAAVERCCDPAAHDQRFHPLDVLEQAYDGQEYQFV